MATVQAYGGGVCLLRRNIQRNHRSALKIAHRLQYALAFLMRFKKEKRRRENIPCHWAQAGFNEREDSP